MTGVQIRIVRTRSKVLFLVAHFVVIVGLGQVLTKVDPSGLTQLIVGTIVGNGVLILAVRIFRVREEDIELPRPLWRLTGRPRAGYWLVALNLFGALSVLPNIFLRPAHETRADMLQRAPVVVGLEVVISLAWAWFYFRSSRRLTRERKPAMSDENIVAS